jgi:hypothetical protein
MCAPFMAAQKKKKKLHHFSHIRLIRRPINKKVWIVRTRLSDTRYDSRIDWIWQVAYEKLGTANFQI